MNKVSKHLIYTVVASVVTSTLITVFLMSLIISNSTIAARILLGPSQTQNTDAAQNPSSTDSVSNIIEKVNPAVVSIIITKNEPVLERYYERFNDPFGGFFEIPIPQYRQKGTEEREVGGGSGFFVSADGLIVTNQHVVSDTDATYTVYTNDGKKHSAKVVARDSALDIALMKIEAVSGERFPFLEFGNSKNLKLGQSVIAIGNALGEFRNTVSVGVVSGLSRSITAGSMAGNIEQLDEVIQTDAAINPGNSGGPLLDLSGKVVGVNVAVAVGSQNIGFALPAHSVETAVASVKQVGYISRPFLGIRYVQITEAIKNSQKLSVDYGILIQKGGSQEPAIIPDSPAARAGIKEGDIILEFSGVKLSSDQKLSSLIRAKKVGDSVKLKILRAGKEIDATVILEEFKEVQS